MTKIGTLCFMGILLYGSICFYLPIQFYLAYAEFEYCSVSSVENLSLSKMH